MIKYIQQEMPLMHADGKKRSFYRVPTFNKISEKEFLDYLANNQAKIGKSAVYGALEQTMEGLCIWLARGHTVKVPHLGTFRLSIGLQKNKEMSPLEEDSTHRNAQSLCVRGIRFKPSKEFMERIRETVILEGDGLMQHLNKVDSNREERLEKLKRKLKSKAFINVSDYMKLTGLLKSSATKELASFAADLESGITTIGYKSHKLYILKK